MPLVVQGPGLVDTFAKCAQKIMRKEVSERDDGKAQEIHDRALILSPNDTVRSSNVLMRTVRAKMVCQRMSGIVC